VDFAAKHLSVTRSIVSQVVGVCKTEASQKPVRLHGSLAQALLEWRRHTSFRKREDWVFASPHSNGKRPYWAQPIMRCHVAPASRRIQLQKRVGGHTFRHTFASRLLERGVDIMTVKELLRHRPSPSQCATPIPISIPRSPQSENSRATATIQLHRATNCSSRHPTCHRFAANPKTTLELEVEEWVSG